MKSHLALAAFAVGFAVAVAQAQKPAEPPARFGVGRPATPAEIAARDIDVGPDGKGLPVGRGTAADGAATYAAKCASCHGKTGKEGPNDVLVGRGAFPSGKETDARRTIGNYWPYATTVFDYVRRAMPTTAPGSLTDDEVYGVVAFLLAANEIIPADAVMDAMSLPKVVMPAHDKFVIDPRGGPKTKPRANQR
jgi:S-disulfanyl-L-cysteine oxidoreductase SoxD